MSSVLSKQGVDTESLKRQGINFFEAGEWVRALEIFDTAAIANPFDTELHNYRARVLDRLERFEEALSAIDRALAIDPHSAADLKNRAILLRKRGRLSEALASFEAALTLRPGDVDLSLRCVQLLEELTQPKEALRHIQRVLSLHPDDESLLEVRERLLAQMGSAAATPPLSPKSLPADRLHDAVPNATHTAVGDAPARETIRFVCATRYSTEEFLTKSHLGRSLPLYRAFPRGQRIELRLFKENKEGLPTVYNTAIEESRSDPAVLVFIHDDVLLSDYYWVNHLFDGLRVFDVVGLAGNRRRVTRQVSWMYINDHFERDADENLSGVLGHGESFPNLRELSVYGEPGQECKLLDGVLLAVRSETLIANNLCFDPRFTFHFYDLDFCRQAELRGIRMGTWSISAIHASAGRLGSPPWRAAYRDYLAKYDEI